VSVMAISTVAVSLKADDRIRKLILHFDFAQCISFGYAQYKCFGYAQYGRKGIRRFFHGDFSKYVFLEQNPQNADP
jgi:hypothetical protein